MVMSSVVERCRALSSVVESNLIKVKIVDRRCSTFLLFEVLSSAFGQVLDFPLDIAELTHVQLIIFPTKIAVRKALPSKNSSKFCNINRRSS